MVQRDYLKEEAITIASAARFPSGKLVNRVTFWRWCQALGLSSEFFSQADIDRLVALAKWLADGNDIDSYILEESKDEHPATEDNK
jgi:hypothetical protein